MIIPFIIQKKSSFSHDNNRQQSPNKKGTNMTISKSKMTRREEIRQNYEEHFYATWPSYIKSMTDQQLIDFNKDDLKNINAGYSDTMLWLKSFTLQEIVRRGVL